MKVGLLAAAVTGLLIGGAGTALAVSSGTFSPPQQDCPWAGSAWSTPQDQTYPGCHSAQISVESGGTTNGNPDDGYNDSSTTGSHGARNTTWVQYGNNEAPNDKDAQGTPTPYSLGYPGTSTSPHAGCLSVNTDGTGGGAAPAGSPPQSPGTAVSNPRYGCGNNPEGVGFSLAYDYYNYYCPVAAVLARLMGYPACEAVPGGDEGTTSLTPDTGGRQNLTSILTNGLIVYYGMDDNTDNGEHDGEGPGTSPGTAGAIDGPSDGGGIMLAFTPQSARKAPSLTQPESVANASLGFCADGNCANATTERQSVYEGCAANTGEQAGADRCPKGKAGSSRDAADYQGKAWDPYACSSGGGPGQSPEPDSPAACDTSKSNPSPSGSTNSTGGEDYWRQQEAQNVYAEPGVQVYEDPDPEASPATPIYPDPGVYAGTCGVILGGGAAAAPNSPLTDGAHQVALRTGC
jgi:hypothetical protein